jgi:hypothetical protein
MPKQNPWLDYVNKVRAKNPKLSYKECLMKAKKTYKKKSNPNSKK